MILVADVHDASAALARVAAMGEPMLVLGDLANLIDYRTGEGIVAEVIGLETVLRISHLRSVRAYAEATSLWRERVAGVEGEVDARIGDLMTAQYLRAAEALNGAEAYVTYGNADRPDLLREILPPSARFVDAEVLQIEGWTIGVVGGGVPRLGTPGEVSPGDMEAKLDAIGAVDVLCTHVAPAIDPLARDVVGRGFKGSPEILEYLTRHQPLFHFFGDIHQPQAVSWTYGTTLCRNVGYFRATGRPFMFERRSLHPRG